MDVNVVLIEAYSYNTVAVFSFEKTEDYRSPL